jgi:U3 small nucleolar ribonucleoprotein component
MTELEEKAVGEKEWEMRGEVSAKSRPLNSVLDAELDFEARAL